MKAEGEFRLRRRLETPSLASLEEHYQRGEAISKWQLAAEFGFITVSLVYLVAYPSGLRAPLPWVAAGIAGLGVFRWIPRHYFLNKKRIEDIRRDARFGEHSRDTLVRLVDRVFAAAGVGRDAVPVFMTREKDINAVALRCELWPGKNLFNGVFLNRSIIHLLDEAELATIIGHELGHVRPYAPLLSRCYGVHCACAALTVMAVSASMPHLGVVAAAIVLVLGLLDAMIWFAHSRLSRGIEFLCDSHGARLGGLPAALSAEMKVAAEIETRQELLQQVLEARTSGLRLGIDQLLETYQEAVPFGRASTDLVRQQLQALLAVRAEQSKGLSLRGFLDDLGGRDSAALGDEISGQLQSMRLCQELPLAPVRREDYLAGPAAFGPEAAARLMRAIADHPECVLFRLEHEVDDRGATHPNPSRRLLFLWRSMNQGGESS